MSYNNKIKIKEAISLYKYVMNTRLACWISWDRGAGCIKDKGV
jgi:hypothetical protein